MHAPRDTGNTRKEKNWCLHTLLLPRCRARREEGKEKGHYLWIECELCGKVNDDVYDFFKKVTRKLNDGPF